MTRTMASHDWYPLATQLAAELLVEPMTPKQTIAWCRKHLGISEGRARQLLAYGDGDLWRYEDGQWRVG